MEYYWVGRGGGGNQSVYFRTFSCCLPHVSLDGKVLVFREMLSWGSWNFWRRDYPTIYNLPSTDSWEAQTHHWRGEWGYYEQKVILKQVALEKVFIERVFLKPIILDQVFLKPIVIDRCWIKTWITMFGEDGAGVPVKNSLMPKSVFALV